MRDRLSLRLGLLCMWAALGAVAHAAAGSADDPRANAREELFRRVFHHAPPPFPVESQVVVMVDANLRQSLRAVYADDTREILLEGRPLIALLSQYLRADLTAQLEQRIDSRGLLDRAAIEATGLATAFNPRTFEYSLTSAQEMRLPAVVYLTPPLSDPFTVPAARPAAVSGFVNFNARGVERKISLATTSRMSREVAIALDGAVNVQGAVLEGSAFGRAGAADSWSRGDLRLVYDRPRQALRFMAGDLTYPVTGYQTGAAIAGIGLTKDYALQPQLLTYWTGEFAFKLDRPAQVQLFSNDSLITTLQLPAGVHDLRRFTPAVGQNDIDIVIEDSAGSREVLHYSFLHDPRLLAKGLSLYSWNAGFARRVHDGSYHYDTSQPVFAGSYLRGLTMTTTLGDMRKRRVRGACSAFTRCRDLPAATCCWTPRPAAAAQAGGTLPPASPWA
jgi:outer membrane usher protein